MDGKRIMEHPINIDFFRGTPMTQETSISGWGFFVYGRTPNDPALGRSQRCPRPAGSGFTLLSERVIVREWGHPNWLVYFMEHPIDPMNILVFYGTSHRSKWMMTGGTPMTLDSSRYRRKPPAGHKEAAKKDHLKWKHWKHDGEPLP